MCRRGRVGGWRQWVALCDEDCLSLSLVRCHRSSGALQEKTLPLFFGIVAEQLSMVFCHCVGQSLRRDTVVVAQDPC